MRAGLFAFNNLEHKEIKCIFASSKTLKITTMEGSSLNPTQMHLLKLFSFNNSESYALEIQKVLTRYFQAELDAESDKLWEDGTLNQSRLDELRHKDLHAIA